MNFDNIPLKQGERIEDLQVGNLYIIQSDTEYRFTSDAVLLANFVHHARNKKIVELCSGSGVISILVAYKQQPASIVGIEIQPNLADMSIRSVQLCNLQDKIRIICDDARTCTQLDTDYDIVICNPPYGKVGSGEAQKNQNLALARHEITFTLQDAVASAGRLLCFGGSFYLVHQANRLTEIFSLFDKCNLMPKEMRLISSRVDSAPNLVLIRATKGGKSGLTILPNIVMFDNNGNYTQTVKALYTIKE